MTFVALVREFWSLSDKCLRLPASEPFHLVIDVNWFAGGGLIQHIWSFGSLGWPKITLHRGNDFLRYTSTGAWGEIYPVYTIGGVKYLDSTHLICEAVNVIPRCVQMVFAL